MSKIIYPNNENRLKEIMDNLYNTDHDKYGFYPNYTQQKLKILYIGRESRDLDSGTNYIEYIYNCYTGKERKISGKSVNKHAFHRRLLKISYGLIMVGHPESIRNRRTFRERERHQFCFYKFVENQPLWQDFFGDKQ